MTTKKINKSIKISTSILIAVSLFTMVMAIIQPLDRWIQVAWPFIAAMLAFTIRIQVKTISEQQNILSEWQKIMHWEPEIPKTRIK